VVEPDLLGDARSRLEAEGDRVGDEPAEARGVQAAELAG